MDNNGIRKAGEIPEDEIKLVVEQIRLNNNVVAEYGLKEAAKRLVGVSDWNPKGRSR